MVYCASRVGGAVLWLATALGTELSLGMASRFGMKNSGRRTMSGAQRSAFTWVLIGVSNVDLTRLEKTSRNIDALSTVLGRRLLSPVCM